MRILHVINYGTTCGGAERLTADLVGHQRAQGHEVRVLAADVSRQGERFADVTWPRSAGLVARARNWAWNGAARTTLRTVVATFRPDVVHLQCAGEMSPASLAAIAHIPTVMTVHGPEVFIPPLVRWSLPGERVRADADGRATLDARGAAGALFARALSGPLWRRTLRHVDLFITPSRAYADLVGPFVGPVRVVPNAVGAGARYGDARRHGTTRILYAGRLEPFKGVHVLMAAFPAVVAAHPSATVVVIGEGPARADLEARVQRAGLSRVVEFTGWLPAHDVAAYYRTADVAVVPSLWPESFGLVCAEALAAGSAVVASAVGGLPELVRHEESGLLVPPGDPAALAAAISRLLADASLRRRLAATGARFAAELTIDAHARRVSKVYAEAANERARAPRRGIRKSSCPTTRSIPESVP